jgi:hypothetical protein
MRLVLNSRAGAVAGLKRYKGEGIFSSIGRKVVLSGLKRIISTIENKDRWQKIADAVVNGHKHNQIDTNQVAITTKKRTTGVKRKPSEQPQLSSLHQPPSKAKKYSSSTIDKLINHGDGILIE